MTLINIFSLNAMQFHAADNTLFRLKTADSDRPAVRPMEFDLKNVNTMIPYGVMIGGGFLSFFTGIGSVISYSFGLYYLYQRYSGDNTSIPDNYYMIPLAVSAGLLIFPIAQSVLEFAGWYIKIFFNSLMVSSSIIGIINTALFADLVNRNPTAVPITGLAVSAPLLSVTLTMAVISIFFSFYHRFDVHPFSGRVVKINSETEIRLAVLAGGDQFGLSVRF
jgi:hypothetical protein